MDYVIFPYTETSISVSKLDAQGNCIADCFIWRFKELRREVSDNMWEDFPHLFEYKGIALVMGYFFDI